MAFMAGQGGGTRALAQPSSIFELEFPRSLAVYDTYAEAQQAVDYLSDNKFEVKNLCIVGTDLKSMERVLGRRNWGTVISNGALQGISTGLLIGLIMLLFVPVENILILLLVAVSLAVALSIIFQAIGYAASGGRRDFTSVTQTVATKYEVLCEHRSVAEAKRLMSEMPGQRAVAFSQPTANPGATEPPAGRSGASASSVQPPGPHASTATPPVAQPPAPQGGPGQSSPAPQGGAGQSSPAPQGGAGQASPYPGPQYQQPQYQQTQYQQPQYQPSATPPAPQPTPPAAEAPTAPPPTQPPAPAPDQRTQERSPWPVHSPATPPAAEEDRR